jgi:ribosomal-protein-alanine N-acetyltransferase
MAFVLRPYTAADFETLYELDQACYPRGIAYSRRTLRWGLTAPGADCLIAEAKGEPAQPDSMPNLIGFILVEEEPPDAHIITLDVAASHRRLGVGTALLDEIEGRMAARGVRRVGLETATDNEAGVAFWKRHGYRAVGLLPRYYLDRIDALAMTKNLPKDAN